MTRYAVGDIQGCLEPLKHLLKLVDFNPDIDQLWLVGDLINRGPDSLGTLRFIHSLGDCTRIVLGNHDLHFLAVAHDAERIKTGDTFFDILASDKRADYVEWLCQQPLLYTDPSGDYTMVHAGIPPQWNLAQAQHYAKEAEAALQGPARLLYLRHIYGHQPDCWNDNLHGWDRLRLITNYLTRLRFCTREGRLDLVNKTDHHDDPTMAPWFTYEHRKTKHHSLVFGHWSTIRGETHIHNVHALDTACVWGGTLTLMNLETQQRHHYP